MARYKIAGDGIKDTETGRFIPRDPRNRDYCGFLAWCAGLDLEDESIDEDPREPDPEFTHEESVQQDRADRLQAQVVALKSHDINLFEMVVAMYDAGLAAGTWTAADFPPALVTLAQDWKGNLQSIDAIKNEVATKPVDKGM